MKCVDAYPLGLRSNFKRYLELQRQNRDDRLRIFVKQLPSLTGGKQIGSIVEKIISMRRDLESHLDQEAEEEDKKPVPVVEYALAPPTPSNMHVDEPQAAPAAGLPAKIFASDTSTHQTFPTKEGLLVSLTLALLSLQSNFYNFTD